MKVLAAAFLLFATAAIEVNTSKVADGTTQSFVSGSRKVAVHKSGDTTTVVVQEGDRLDTVMLTRTEGKLDVGRRNNGVTRRFLVVDRPKVVVDGIDLEPYLMDEVARAPQPAPMMTPMPLDGALEATPMPTVPETPHGLKPAPMPMPRRSPAPGATRYFVCPKDATVVITPQPSPDGKIRCPLDGAEMKAHTGRDSKYFLLQ
jgi:hypothetical protein